MGFEDEFYAADGADWSLLAAALACLSHPEATVIRLHDGSGLSFEEIGETIGLDATSARSAWARGLKDLARLCNGHPGVTSNCEPDSFR